MDEPFNVKCPSCKIEHLWRTDNAFRPFCSERCKLMDTAAWAEGRYAVSRALTQDDEEFILKHHPDAESSRD